MDRTERGRLESQLSLRSFNGPRCRCLHGRGQTRCAGANSFLHFYLRRQGRSAPTATHIPLNACPMDNIVDVIGRNTWFCSGRGNVEHLTGQSAAFAHGFLSLGVENFNLVSMSQRTVVLWIPILPPDRVRNRLGQGSVLRQRINGA